MDSHPESMIGFENSSFQRTKEKSIQRSGLFIGKNTRIINQKNTKIR